MIFAGATIPQRIFKYTTTDFFKQKIKDIEIVESERMHKLGEGVDFQWIQSTEDNE